MILALWGSEPDHKGWNPSGKTKKKRKKPVQQKSVHAFITKETLTPPTTQLTMKITNQNDTPQHRSPTYSNDTSTASCALQVDERNIIKELILDPSYSSDIIYDYLEDKILLTNRTEIKNGIDFCQEDDPEQEPVKIDTDIKDSNRFNPQQNKDDSRNIQYDKRDGNAFTRSYRINLPGTGEIIPCKN